MSFMLQRCNLVTHLYPSPKSKKDQLELEKYGGVPMQSSKSKLELTSFEHGLLVV